MIELLDCNLDENREKAPKGSDLIGFLESAQRRSYLTLSNASSIYVIGQTGDWCPRTDRESFATSFYGKAISDMGECLAQIGCRRTKLACLLRDKERMLGNR